MSYSQYSILVAEDDAEDRDMIKEAFDINGYKGRIDFVSDGQELIDKLYHHIPHIILLDLNMPRKDGREALMEIRATERLRKIPVIILSTSSLDKDINTSYYLGCNCYIIKPGNFNALTNAVHSITNYWLNLYRLPTCL